MTYVSSADSAYNSILNSVLHSVFLKHVVSGAIKWHENYSNKNCLIVTQDSKHKLERLRNQMAHKYVLI